MLGKEPLTLKYSNDIWGTLTTCEQKKLAWGEMAKIRSLLFFLSLIYL